ncbi:hypothetical protein LP419_24305 [Massilia sp. H-1]|nr:hypothetical protein LP419_24305 [Massilia sp. H-1]
MGYHLAILRTEGATARPIGRAELLAALPSMGARLAPDADSAALQLIDPARGQDSPLLCFGADGELWSSSPDPAFIALMIELAALLGARARRRVRNVPHARRHLPPPRRWAHAGASRTRQCAARAAGASGTGALGLGVFVLLMAGKFAWQKLSHQ